ncbi:hypothetical protein L1987_14853 [Smallanthus sonchifolius]|uniref:Uncharacterized protein n=1 Tax=Smallanthus sonchifolius TaxID=185202 RepID=A0ACB9J688_9ASTR|nr:hypothetical protein L1987_14853 [Smallanthus sonchifolius]
MRRHRQPTAAIQQRNDSEGNMGQYSYIHRSRFGDVFAAANNGGAGGGSRELEEQNRDWGTTGQNHSFRSKTTIFGSTGCHGEAEAKNNVFAGADFLAALLE